MNNCYSCDKCINKQPYNGKRSYCQRYARKWAVTIREEQQGKEPKKKDIAAYWLK